MQVAARKSLSRLGLDAIVTPIRYADIVEPADTAPEARRRQLEVYRAMTPRRRVELALALSEDIRRVAIDGIKQRNPAFDDEHVSGEWLRMLHGPDLTEALLAYRAGQ